MDRKVAVGMCGKSDARGRNPPVLFLRTCHLPHLVRHVHKHVAPPFVNALKLDCGCNHIA